MELTASESLATGEAFTKIPSRGKQIEVHALLSGLIAEKKSTGNLARQVFSNGFGEMQPVWIFLIVHPSEGLILVDTGQHPDTVKQGHFKPAGLIQNWFLRSQFDYLIKDEHRLEGQLAQLGYRVTDISRVILTHLHFDHTGNLSLFKGLPIMLSKAEWVKPYYAVQALHPSWFKPDLILFSEKEPSADYLLEQAFLIGASSDLLYVSTPGHTHGHASVMILGDTFAVLLAGDVSATAAGLFSPQGQGEANNFESRMSRWKIVEFAKKLPLVYLPSHDPDVPLRLRDSVFL